MPNTQDVRWRVGDVITDGLLSGQPTWNVGEKERLEFYVGDESVDGTPDQTRALEGAYGGDIGATMGGASPACYGAPAFHTPDGGRPRDEVYLNPDETPYGRLKEFVRYAGTATVEQSIDGVPIVREQVPARADVESFIVDIEPVGSDSAWATGAWVLVDSATDTSVVADHDAWLAVELSVTTLAPLGEYESRAALKDDMEPPIVPEETFL